MPKSNRSALEGSLIKRVLIIVHLPRASPRIAGLVNYLPEFNWEPIILTGATTEHQNLAARIIMTPYQHALGRWGRFFNLDDTETDVRQKIEARFAKVSRTGLVDFFLTRAGEFINYPCPDKNWQTFAIQAGNQLFQTEHIDAIISSSPPIIGNLIAKELKDRYKIPWLADFRDLWSQVHSSHYSSLRKLFDRRLELKTLSTADALVTISQPWAEKLRRLHQGKKVYLITHGFDPAEVNNPPTNLTDKFTITYTGLIYTGKQDPLKLFAALRDLISEGVVDPKKIEVRFYGSQLEWLDKEIEKFRLSNIAKRYGTVPRQIALEKQRESQLLVKFKWEDPKEGGSYSSKLFEYLAARRPILATGGADDVVSELLNETKAGSSALTVADIKKMLSEQYQEYQLKGEVTYQGELAKINKYSHREMARKFSEILDRLTPK